MQPSFGLRGKKKTYKKNGYLDDNRLRTREIVSPQPQILPSLLRAASHVAIALFQSEKKKVDQKAKQLCAISRSNVMIYIFSYFLTRFYPA